MSYGCGFWIQGACQVGRCRTAKVWRKHGPDDGSENLRDNRQESLRNWGVISGGPVVEQKVRWGEKRIVSRRKKSVWPGRVTKIVRARVTKNAHRASGRSGAGRAPGIRKFRKKRGGGTE